MRIPIVGLAILFSGLILVAPLLVQLGVSKEFAEKNLKNIHPRLKLIGKIDVILGLIGLVNRMGIIHISFWPGGYPQALLVIILGFIFWPEGVKKFPAVHKFFLNLKPYEEYIGVVGILFGLSAIF